MKMHREFNEPFLLHHQIPKIEAMIVWSSGQDQAHQKYYVGFVELLP